MTGLDKRTILSSKRARNKRKKAQRSSVKPMMDAETENNSGELTPTDGSSGDEAARRATRAATITQSQMDEHDDPDDDLDDEELVFVCRPTMQDFCVEYVAAAPPVPMSGATIASAWADLRQFTVRIPAFRETRDGYTTYSITVTTAGDWRKQFQLERRYSEFVAFASALDEYFQSPLYQQLREKLLGTEEEDVDGDNQPHPQPFCWELPPKTWLPMTQATALEDRRSKLEASLQTLFDHDPNVICHIPIVRDFLMLDIFGAQVVEEKLQRV